VELGAKTIWLSPIYKSPMKASGYDIEDFKEVDGSFGSLQDFKGLVQAIRARGKRSAGPTLQCDSYILQT
jgi:glycosidase